MNQITAAGRTAEIYGDPSASGPLVWLPSFGDEGREVYEACQTLEMPDFRLAVVQTDDWNRALSPWPAPAVYKGEEAFSGDADRFLKTLTDGLLPEAEKALHPSCHMIAGYSLAGLFAVYALFRTDAFTRAASVSGSLWFPGFAAFVREHPLSCAPEAVYFSLGDKECRTRNAVMASVQDCTQEVYAHFRSLGIPAVFELNPGGHFQEPALRTAKGIRWMLMQ